MASAIREDLPTAVGSKQKRAMPLWHRPLFLVSEPSRLDLVRATTAGVCAEAQKTGRHQGVGRRFWYNAAWD
jgi:hypothetical protein